MVIVRLNGGVDEATAVSYDRRRLEVKRLARREGALNDLPRGDHYSFHARPTHIQTATLLEKLLCSCHPFTEVDGIRVMVYNFEVNKRGCMGLDNAFSQLKGSVPFGSMITGPFCSTMVFWLVLSSGTLGSTTVFLEVACALWGVTLAFI